MEPGTNEKILQSLRMSKESIPFKYLGVPLHSKKSTYNECSPLIDKITDKLHNWSIKFLSYGGRVELVKSVIIGMRNF